MKRILNTLLITAFSALAFSCQERMEVEMPMNESIVLDLTCGLTKADDTSTESFVNHLDVFIFDVNGTVPDSKVYYGRYNVNNASKVSLNALRSSFVSGQRYYVYLIANSVLTEADMSAVADYEALLNMKQEDENVHITGLTLPNAPKYFLMDAIAKDASDASPVVLNNGVASDNTELKATLKRAAAKVYVNITATDKISFRSFGIEDGSEGGLYYIRNLSYDTFLLEEAKTPDQIYSKVRTTTKANNDYFSWNPNVNEKNVTLVAYVYPNHWIDDSLLEHETCLIMNLPLSYTDGGVTTDHYNSWYKIPMTDEQMFQRNNYYEVNISLNRPGATSETTPIDVTDVNYVVEDWISEEISVGGEDKPKYLMVNKTEMEMRNISLDETTLEFASSSPITVTVEDVYYYDKFGAIQNESVGISGTTETGSIAGNISVSSPVPTNQTIRYFTLVISNEDGLSREVQVSQYPLEYITNKVSWYSYRSDFIGEGQSVPTTLENISADNDVTSISYTNGTYTYNTGNSNGFFRSKVVRETYSSTHADEGMRGRSDIDGYYWGRGEMLDWEIRLRYANYQDPGNARMYHIQIMASSGDYVLGRPKITDGITDPGEDNAKLVSPSFMIASRLAVITTSNIDLSASGLNEAEANEEYLRMYAEHCKQYVEVYDPDNDSSTDNAIHYDDWRLPTAAEIGIIYKYQGTASESADAIDYLLNAGAYFSASGPVTNPNSDTSGKSVRCIRDAY